jgi:hypothetical protein
MDKSDHMMPLGTGDHFRGELNPDERIIWSGQPQQGFMLRPGDTLLIPFSLLWGGFAIVWESTAIGRGLSSFFALWGIPFVLVGLYMIFGRFFVDRAQRSRTYYALTNQRVIIISGFFSQNIKSVVLAKLQEINITKKRSGKGTITFGPLNPMSWMNSGNIFPNTSRYNVAPSFEMIDDVNKVYQYIKDLQRDASN